MATTAQILANRENAKSSTGPTSTAGKAVSSQNHKTHGFCAVDPVLPTENRDEFNALVAQYKIEHQATSTQREFLCFTMAGAQWKLNRLASIEVAMFNKLESPEKAFTDPETAAAFARLERYRASLERTYHRCARELRLSRKEQFEPNSLQPPGSTLDKLLKADVTLTPRAANERFRPLPTEADDRDDE